MADGLMADWAPGQEEAQMAQTPGFDPGALFDAHAKAEFVDRDLAATMATMVAEPDLLHVPTLAGGHGRAAVADFYGRWFIGHWPADTALQRLTRTVGPVTDGRQVLVDEIVVSFTHDCAMPVYLPGVAPTGRWVRLPHVVVCGFEGEKLAFERIYWDQASLLVQVGLLDPAKVPAAGAEQADRLLDPTRPSNEMLSR